MLYFTSSRQIEKKRSFCRKGALCSPPPQAAVSCIISERAPLPPPSFPPPPSFLFPPSVEADEARRAGDFFFSLLDLFSARGDFLLLFLRSPSGPFFFHPVKIGERRMEMVRRIFSPRATNSPPSLKEVRGFCGLFLPLFIFDRKGNLELLGLKSGLLFPFPPPPTPPPSSLTPF